MKTYVCRSHDGVWMSGNSVVVAPNKNKARALLDKALLEANLNPHSWKYDLEEVPENTAVVVWNGDY